MKREIGCANVNSHYFSRGKALGGSEICTIRLLGPLSVSGAEGMLPAFTSQKTQALLAMIAVAGPRGLDRDTAAAMLWHRSTDAQARTNLRQTLTSLRKSLGPYADMVESQGSTLKLARDRVDLDTDRLARSADEKCQGDRVALLMQSEAFLAGLSINEPPFEDWLQEQRVRFNALLSSSLFDTAEALIAADRLADALAMAQKLLGLDDFNEAAHRLVMRIMHARGETASALRQFDGMQATLAAELGIAPGAKTLSLLREIRAAVATTDDVTAAGDAADAAPSCPDGANGAVDMTRRQRARPPSDKPSIAVLPFRNLSDDPEQTYFSAGITEDIVAELSRFSTLHVSARHSAPAFSQATTDLREVSRKHGVQYIVEGSVRRAGNRVRITAQLIESTTENHIWSIRCDRELENVFDIQDEVTRCIVAALPGRVQEDVAERARRKRTGNMTSYELMLRGKALRDGLDAAGMVEARGLLEKAIALDPRHARAHMYLADTYVVDGWLGLGGEDAAAKSLELTRKAVALDSNDVFLQDQLGFAFLSAGMWADAEMQFDKTLSQIVNEAESMAWCGYAFMMLGQHEKGRDIVFRAMRLDTALPPAIHWVLGQAYSFAGQYEDVVRVLIGAALLNSLAHAFLAGAYARLGRPDEAREALAAFIGQRRHEFDSRNMTVAHDTVEALAGGYRGMWRSHSDWDHIADGLRKAGLPD